MYAELVRNYEGYSALKENSGFGWNDELQIPTAPSSVWDDYQVAQFTFSAVWGVRSCTSAYKYSVRLQQCEDPRRLSLEASYNRFFDTMDFSREKSIIAPSVENYRVYTPIPWGGV